MSCGLELIPLALIMLSGAIGMAQSRSVKDSIYYETNFTDADLLVAALEKNGCPVTQDGQIITARFGQRVAQFRRKESGSFDAVLNNKIPFEEVKNFFGELYTSYMTMLQEKLYQQVIERAENNGMKLEKEIVHEDNSIELVLLVEDGNG